MLFCSSHFGKTREQANFYGWLIHNQKNIENMECHDVIVMVNYKQMEGSENLLCFKIALY